MGRFKTLVLLSGITLGICSTANAQEASEELVCFNVRCFKPSVSKSSIVDTSTTRETNLKPDLENISIFKDSMHLASDSSMALNTSKYYESINTDGLQHTKQFLNVPSTDMIYETNPYMEASRPAFALFYINKPKKRQERLY